MIHIVIIQAAYSDERLSRRRLEISRHTSIPSLAYQTAKPIVHLAISVSDPYATDRLDAFSDSGCEVRPLYRDDWKLYREDWDLPPGRKIVSRLDDDDVWAKDFCERTQAAAPATGEHALLWPSGYVFWRSRIFHLVHPGNQFVSLVTDAMTDPHQEQHWQYPKLWHSVTVGNDSGWLWTRHGDAATSTLPRYRRKQLQRIDSQRMPINLRAIERAIKNSGIASGNYSEKLDQDTHKKVFAENAKHAPSGV